MIHVYGLDVCSMRTDMMIIYLFVVENFDVCACDQTKAVLLSIEQKVIVVIVFENIIPMNSY